MKIGSLKRFFSGFLALSIVFGFSLQSLAAVAEGVLNTKYNPYYSELIQDGSGISFASGTGTVTDPFVIKTPEQLSKVCKSSNTATRGKYYVLANDIYLNGNADTDWSNVDWANGKMDDGTDILRWLVRWGWNDADLFEGNFNGQGHSVYGLFEDAGVTGLFPNIGCGAVIKNVTVDHAWFNANNVGAIAGGVGVDGTEAPQIKNCGVGSDVTLAGSQGCGGILGNVNAPVSISNCYFVGTLKNYDFSSDTSVVNGFIGTSWTAITVRGSYTLGYRLVKGDQEGKLSVTDSYAQAAQGSVTVLTDTGMKGDDAKANMTELEWLGTWKTVDNGYPVFNDTAYAGGNGSKEAPFLISNSAQLKKLVASNDTAGKYYKLTNDIVVNENIDADPENWFFVSSETDDRFCFAGDFDGAGHKISGLYINLSAGGYWYGTGLFPTATADAKIHDVAVVNSSLTLKDGKVGSIIGYIFLPDSKGNLEGDGIPTVSRCYADESVTLVSGGSGVGGIVGCTVGRTDIKDCGFTGSVSASSDTFGGIVGAHWNYTLLIIRCYTTSTTPPVSDAITYSSVYTTCADAPYNESKPDNSPIIVSESDITGANAAATMPNFDFNSVWQVSPNGYPVLRVFYKNAQRDADEWSGNIAEAYDGGTGTAEDPILISNAEQLAKLVNDTETAGKYYELTSDIVINKDLDVTALNWFSATNADASDECFLGNFNGAGHTVSGLYYFGGGDSMWFTTALFPKIGEGAKIFGVALENSLLSVYSQGTVGGIVGTVCTGKAYEGETEANRPTVTACFVGNSVALSGASYSGGIVGVVTGEAEITDCCFAGRLLGNGCGAAVGTHWGECVTLKRFIALDYEITAPSDNSYMWHYYDVYTTGTDYSGYSRDTDSAFKVSKEAVFADALSACPNINWKDGFMVRNENAAPTYNVSAVKNYNVYEVGDTNADGNISADDLVTLRKGLLGVSDAYNADTTADGKVDIRDLVRLKKKIG